MQLQQASNSIYATVPLKAHMLLAGTAAQLQPQQAEAAAHRQHQHLLLR
jgi:hypothetical protein